MDFLFIANHPGLDFVNTKPVANGQPIELLATDEELGRWYREAGLGLLVTEGLDQGEAVAQAIAFREATRALVQSRWDGLPVHDALNEVNQYLSRLGPLQVANDDGHLREVHGGDGTPLGQAMAPLFALVARMLTETDPRKIRRCANPACVLWFLDVTKSGMRRWHSMETCGNSHKARKHRQKAKS